MSKCKSCGGWLLPTNDSLSVFFCPKCDGGLDGVDRTRPPTRQQTKNEYEYVYTDTLVKKLVDCAEGIVPEITPKHMDKILNKGCQITYLKDGTCLVYSNQEIPELRLKKKEKWQKPEKDTMTEADTITMAVTEHE